MSGPTRRGPGSDPVPTAVGRAWRAALALVVVAAAAPAIAHVYGPGWLVPVAGAAVLPIVLDLVVRLVLGRGQPLVLVALHALGVLLWTSVAIRPALDGATALGGAGDGVARILTAVPPVDPRGPELAVAVLATWVVAAATAAVLARPRPSLLAALPAVALFAGALVLGDPRRSLADGAALGLVAACGLVLLVGARLGRAPTASPALAGTTARPSAAAVLRPASAVAVAVVAGVLGVALAPAVPGLDDRDRLDLRARIDPPVEVLLAESPLDLVPPRRAATEPQERFTARVGLPAGADGRLWWRLSVLDHVGPGGWEQPTSGYVRAGRTLGPPPADRSASRGTATVDLRLGPAPAGLPLVPTIDRPLEVDPAGLAFEPTTGQLAVPTDRARPERVRLDVSVPTYTRSVLTGAETVDVARDTELPPAVLALARSSVAPSPNDFDRLSSLLDAVATRPSLRLDVAEPGTTADATVAELLVPPPATAPDDGEGAPPDGEGAEVRTANAAQLAAAFAQLARAEGFDVRLVVGYVTGVPGDASRPRQADLRVTDEQLTVWPEVRFQRLGWVPLRVQAPEGTAPTGGGAAPDDAEGTSVVDETVAQQNQPSPPPADPAPAPTDRGDDAVDPSGGGVPWLLVGAALVLVVLVALAGWGPVLRARRRRRRAAGDGPTRVLGAWDELVDRLAEHGVDLGADHTRPDVVGRVGAAVEATPPDLAWLASTADAVEFGGGAARRLDPAGEDGSDPGARAWALVEEVDGATRSRLSRRQRVVATLRPPRRLRTSVAAGHG